MKKTIITCGIFATGVALLFACLFLSGKESNRSKAERLPGQSAASGVSEHREKISVVAGSQSLDPSREQHAVILKQATASLKKHQFQHPEVAVILGTAGNERFPVRLRALDALRGDLSIAERDAFYTFLLERNLPEGLQSHHVRALKNDMMNVLRAQEEAPVRLTDVLIRMLRDQDQDIIMRDYSIQHLSLWYENMSARERTATKRAFSDALNETDSNIAATALLAFYHLASDHDEIDPEWTRIAAKRLLENRDAADCCRLTAVQVCGKLGVKEVLPLAMDLVRNASALTVRLAAVATVGDLGDVHAITFLKEIQMSDNKVLRNAAAAALICIQKRGESDI